MATFGNNNWKTCSHGQLIVTTWGCKWNTPALNKCPWVGNRERIQNTADSQEDDLGRSVLLPLFSKNSHEHISTRWNLREMRIKTTMRYHLTQVRTDIGKRSKANKCWGGCGEKGTLLQWCWQCRLLTASTQNSGEVSQVKSEWN